MGKNQSSHDKVSPNAAPPPQFGELLRAPSREDELKEPREGRRHSPELPHAQLPSPEHVP